MGWGAGRESTQYPGRVGSRSEKETTGRTRSRTTLLWGWGGGAGRKSTQPGARAVGLRAASPVSGRSLPPSTHTTTTYAPSQFLPFRKNQNSPLTFTFFGLSCPIPNQKSNALALTTHTLSKLPNIKTKPNPYLPPLSEREGNRKYFNVLNKVSKKYRFCPA